MYLSPPSKRFWIELPEWVQEAFDERKAKLDMAEKFDSKDAGSIVDRRQRLEWLDPGKLGHALICIGIGQLGSPVNREQFSYVIAGGAISVLNNGHTPDPGISSDRMPHACYDLIALSLPAEQSACPIHPHVAASLLELFKPEGGGGHYEDGWSSKFHLLCYGGHYHEDISSSWSYLKRRPSNEGYNSLSEIPDWACPDTIKIGEAIPKVLEELDQASRVRSR